MDLRALNNSKAELTKQIYLTCRHLHKTGARQQRQGAGKRSECVWWLYCQWKLETINRSKLNYDCLSFSSQLRIKRLFHQESKRTAVYFADKLNRHSLVADPADERTTKPGQLQSKGPSGWATRCANAESEGRLTCWKVRVTSRETIKQTIDRSKN